MKLEVESYTDYWREFYKNHPDPTEFRSMVARDPVLTKIFNFAAVPSIFGGNFKSYPFDQKLTELENISEEDRAYLRDKRIREPNEWLDYLSNLFQLVLATVSVKRALDVSKGGKISQEEKIERLERAFCERLSVYRTITFKENNGIQKSVDQNGMFWPVRFRQVLEERNRKEGTRRTEYQEHFEYLPTKEDINQTFDDLDRFVVTSLQKYRGKVDDVCFGDRENQQLLVQLYYKRAPLFDKPFIFPIRERFRPLLLKIVGRALKMYGRDEAVDKSVEKRFRDLLAHAEGELWKKACNYDESKGVLPRGYFEKTLKFIPDDLRKFRSTTNLPGDPRPQGKYPYCDRYCKEQKRYEDKLPCEFETPEGYCENPTRKKRKLISGIEHSGGSLSDPVNSPNENGEEILRQEAIEGSAVDIELLNDLLAGKLNTDESALYHACYEEECTQKELADRLGITQSSVSEKLAKLEKKVREMIEIGTEVDF